VQSPAELSNPTAERAAKVRESAGAKEDKHDGEDNHQFRNADLGHVPNLLNQMETKVSPTLAYTRPSARLKRAKESARSLINLPAAAEPLPC
jgi:hypothetical protein